MIRMGVGFDVGPIVWVAALALFACHARQPAARASLVPPDAGFASERAAEAGRQRNTSAVPDLTASRAGGLSRRRGSDDRFVAKAIELVASRRGWPRPSALPVVESAGEDLHQWLTTELYAQTPSSAAKAQDRSLSLLGLLPIGYDSSSAVLAVFSKTIRGAYLSTRGSIVLRQGLSPADAGTTLTHEIVHAFEDRLYSLGASLAYQPRHGDRVAALHALAEGEATRLEVEIGRQDLGKVESDFSDEEVLRRLNASLSQVELPALLRRSLIAPYRDGYRFVSYLRRIGNWTLVDAVWRRGLADTAELLHPDHWVGANGELAHRSNPREPLASQTVAITGDAELVFEESLGEQGVRILLEETETAERAAELAAYWRYDNLWLLRTRGGERLAWHLRTARRDQAEVLGSTVHRLLLGTDAARTPCRTMSAGTVALLTHDNDILVVASSHVATGGGLKPAWHCERLMGWARSLAAASSSIN